MSLRILVGLLTLWSLLVAVPLYAQHSTKPFVPGKYCDLTKDDVQVYLSYLKREASHNSLTVLVTTTEGWLDNIDNFNLPLAAAGHGIPPDVRADFASKNKLKCVIRPFDGATNLRFISQPEENRIFAAGWAEFHKKYGKDSEIVTVSRIGFSSDKTLALVHILGAIAHNAAARELCLFELKDGKWIARYCSQTMAV